MLTARNGWVRIAEVNPPELPDMSHRALSGRTTVMVSVNVFGRIRVSPYAFSARITHDTPHVDPTVVVSTRDRNILAIESEVRGALGNGVDSFLVVIGDTVPHIDHLAHHYEIVEHLRTLQEDLPDFEVGMPTRFREWQFRRRIDLGAQFFVAGPVIDPDTVEVVNLAPQGYLEDDLGRAKVHATSNLAQDINHQLEAYSLKERFRRSHKVGNVLFCAVDSIDTRRLIWEAVQNRVGFFADGRMSA
ncbi:MAG: ThiF family adenylyltransferase, partial [Acidimicrobiia bacterium]|nr:ThiF family adenylyltransferase [Acidimicrobiia bacterium]